MILAYRYVSEFGSEAGFPDLYWLERRRVLTNSLFDSNSLEAPIAGPFTTFLGEGGAFNTGDRWEALWDCSVSMMVMAIPIPPAALLFGSALGILVVVRRRLFSAP